MALSCSSWELLDCYQDSGDEILPINMVMHHHITKALAKAGGKINGPGGAAQLLKIHPGTLRKRMDKLGIPYGRKAQI